jgi:hypothetical protein
MDQEWVCNMLPSLDSKAFQRPGGKSHPYLQFPLNIVQVGMHTFNPLSHCAGPHAPTNAQYQHVPCQWRLRVSLVHNCVELDS